MPKHHFYPFYLSNRPLVTVFIGSLAIILIASSSSTQAQPGVATAAPVPAAEPSLRYTVNPSDKLIVLSREMLTTPQAWNDVAKYNRLKDPNAIRAGQQIDIPLRFLKSSPAAGKVVSTDGDATLGGVPMQLGAAVETGAQLKTGANSSAVIELADGSRIKLMPGSLADVVTSRNYAMREAGKSGSSNWFSGLMRLSAGALEALAAKSVNRATPLQIETPTSLVGVRGTEFRVAFEDPASGAARTEVIEGTVRTDNPAQRSGADLPMGTGAVVKPVEKTVNVVTLLPAPDLAGLPSEVLKPQGGWPMPTLAGAAAYRVQVSSDAQFDKIVRDLKVSTGSADLASLANGSWFARVRGIDAQGLEGFNSVKLLAVKSGEWKVTFSTLSLVNGQAVLGFNGQQPNGQPLLATGYSAVRASDAALSQNVVRSDAAAASGSSVFLGDLKPGVYFIRLSARPGSAPGIELPSETYQLEVPGNWGQTVFDQISVLKPVK